MVTEQFELYLIRHGIAAERGDAYPDDAKRPLTSEGIQKLRKAAKARGVSMAHLIREAAEEALRRTEAPRPDPFADLVGVIRDAPADLAEGHDDYLYGSPRRRP